MATKKMIVGIGIGVAVLVLLVVLLSNGTGTPAPAAGTPSSTLSGGTSAPTATPPAASGAATPSSGGTAPAPAGAFAITGVSVSPDVHSAAITWATTRAASCTVTADGPGYHIVLPSETGVGTQHIVHLSGIAMNAPFTYTITATAGGSVVTKNGKFQTFSTPTGGSGISGTVTLGPNCPVANPADSTCADKPYVANLLIINATTNVQVAGVPSAADGTFHINLPPGTYTVEPAPQPTPLPAGTAVTATVYPGKVTSVSIHYDTGIR